MNIVQLPYISMKYQQIFYEILYTDADADFKERYTVCNQIFKILKLNIAEVCRI